MTRDRDKIRTMTVLRRALAFTLSALLVTGGVVSANSAAQAAANAKIRGYVTDSSGKAARTMSVRLFRSDANDKNWTYLRKVNVRSSGAYEVATNGPGRYHLQLVDRRPAYDLNSYARIPNINVNVGKSAVFKNVRVRIGGAIGGSVKVRGKSRYQNGAGATVRAISNEGQVFDVTADKSGQFALGGLPSGTYRVFAYDAKNRRVGSSKLVRKVKLKSFRKVSFKLSTKPSAYRGFLTVGDGNSLAKGAVTVTAVNKRTGEYWVRKVSRGALSLRGLTSGTYTLMVPDTYGYFGRTVTLPRVKPGQTRAVNVNLPVKGGTFTGTVRDQDGRTALKNASVRMRTTDGRVWETTTNSAGRFSIGGTLRGPMSGVTITVLTYGKIGEYTYISKTFGGQSVRNNVNVELHDSGLNYIALSRRVTPTPSTPTPTVTTPTPTETTPTTPTTPTTSPTPVVTTTAPPA